MTSPSLVGGTMACARGPAPRRGPALRQLENFGSDLPLLFKLH